MKLISIITPVFNSQSFLKETIKSVINQTYENWELLLIDDGSTDNSFVICKNFATADKRIKVYSKANGGQGSARNYGIRKAKGEWIALLDADDIWSPEKLNKQIECQESEKGVDLIYSSGYIFTDSVVNKQAYLKWKTGKSHGISFAKELFIQSRIINSSVIVRTELFKRFQFDENPIIKGTEDWDLWLRLALDGAAFFGIGEKLIYYREHNEGIHLDKVKMYLGKEQLYLKYLNHPNIPKLLVKRQMRYVFRELMNHLHEEGKAEAVKAAFNRFKTHDKWGWGTLKQSVLIKLFSLNSFMWWSNKIVYRIAYRLEKFRYLLFLR
jgi:teichuronic acid biosynthesis glycosyltransferase TuaG